MNTDVLKKDAESYRSPELMSINNNVISGNLNISKILKIEQSQWNIKCYPQISTLHKFFSHTLLIMALNIRSFLRVLEF
jgi:hypothetical protein